MTNRRRAAGTCANPLCLRPIYAGELDALELVQVQPDPERSGAAVDARWHVCGIRCARQYLALCELRHAAQSYPETSEAEA